MRWTRPKSIVRISGGQRGRQDPVEDLDPDLERLEPIPFFEVRR
jgi:hypothetical protein